MNVEPLKQENGIVENIGTDPNWKLQYVWRNVVVHIIINSNAVYGLYLMLFWGCWKTTLWVFICAYLGNVGVSVGAHRLYTHKSFKATYALRLVLVLLQTVAGQNSLYIWVRDHRQHHKFSDTDADPHNATRGFFFSHMGWLMVKKHPAVIAYGKKLDLSDLEADPIVTMQRKYFLPLYLVLAIAIPVAVPIYFWNETLATSFFAAYAFRYAYSLHGTWLVNSAAHKFGMKPYNKNIVPVETEWVGWITVGEQYHNYHHTFPWDYRASELGMKWNISALIIDALAYLGLAYDLRTMPGQSVKHRAMKTGDGSYYPVHNKPDVRSTALDE